MKYYPNYTDWYMSSCKEWFWISQQSWRHSNNNLKDTKWHWPYGCLCRTGSGVASPWQNECQKFKNTACQGRG